MAYCTTCGKQNPDTGKFCVSCGAPLKTQAVKPPPAPAVTEQPVPAAAPALKRRNNWLIAGIVLVLGLAAGAYFIFFNKKKKDTKEDTAVNTPAAVPGVDTPVAKSAPVTLQPSDAVSLGGADTGTLKTEITTAETDQVKSTIESFYSAEDREDVNALLSYYRFPIDQYYQYYNISYDQLHKMVVDAFNGKLYYHKIDIKWNYSSVQKLPTGEYKVLLYADYTASSQGGDDRHTKSIHLTIVLNNNYEITSIYPS